METREDITRRMLTRELEQHDFARFNKVADMFNAPTDMRNSIVSRHIDELRASRTSRLFWLITILAGAIATVLAQAEVGR